MDNYVVHLTLSFIFTLKNPGAMRRSGRLRETLRTFRPSRQRQDLYTPERPPPMPSTTEETPPQPSWFMKNFVCIQNRDVWRVPNREALHFLSTEQLGAKNIYLLSTWDEDQVQDAIEE
jgi:hypothetical protein